MAAKRSTKKPASKKAGSTTTRKPARSGSAKKSASKPSGKPAGKPARKASTKPPGAARRSAAQSGGDGAAADQVNLVHQILDVMEARGAVEVEFKDGDFKLRVRRREEHPPAAWGHAMPMAPSPVGAPPMHAPQGYAPNPGVGAEPAEDPDALPPGTEVFASPMVGTFYRAAQPDAEPFVKDGDRVGEQHVLCIIEAMKVMNEITAERSFEVVRTLAENGEPVEFGQPLFVIKA